MDQVSKEGGAGRPENPGAGGSIPSQPTISFQTVARHFAPGTSGGSILGPHRTGARSALAADNTYSMPLREVFGTGRSPPVTPGSADSSPARWGPFRGSLHLRRRWAVGLRQSVWRVGA